MLHLSIKDRILSFLCFSNKSQFYPDLDHICSAKFIRVPQICLVLSTAPLIGTENFLIVTPPDALCPWKPENRDIIRLLLSYRLPYVVIPQIAPIGAARPCAIFSLNVTRVGCHTSKSLKLLIKIHQGYACPTLWITIEDCVRQLCAPLHC